MKKFEAKIGMKVHPLGRGGTVLYIIEIGEKAAGLSSNKNSSPEFCYEVNYERLVKFKNQC